MEMETLPGGMAQSSQDVSKRRVAASQLGGPRDAQLYYDSDRSEPVVLTKKDGWGMSKDDYMERTWYVQSPRCYVADAGCELEVITQRTKLNRMETDRYEALPDEVVDQILDTAVDKNREWMRVNSPHIPYDGDGGVNVYVEGECLEHKAVEAPSQILAKDNWPDYEVAVRVNYDPDDKHLEVEMDGDTIPYSRSNDPDTIEEGVEFAPDSGFEGPTVELRVDSECEEHHETEYDITEVGIDVE